MITMRSNQVPQQGWGQQSPAVQQIIRSGIGAVRSIASRVRKKRSKTAAGRKSKKRATGSRKRASRSVARLVKGSAAAKRYMAKIRKLRK